MCWAILNCPEDGNEVEGPALVSIVNIELSLELYKYYVASEFDRFEGLCQKMRVCWYCISISELKNICSFSRIG
jgi:hypothetical protein